MYLIAGRDDFETKVCSIKYRMFLQTLPFPFHSRAVPMILITLICHCVDLTEIRNSRDLLVTDIGLLLMLFIEYVLWLILLKLVTTRNYDDRSGNVLIGLVPTVI